MSYITKQEFEDLLLYHNGLEAIMDTFIVFLTDKLPDVANELSPKNLSEIYTKKGKTGLVPVPMETHEEYFKKFLGQNEYVIEECYNKFKNSYKSITSIKQLQEEEKRAGEQVTEFLRSKNVIRFVPFKPLKCSGDHKTFLNENFEDIIKVAKDSLTCKYWYIKPTIMCIEDVDQLSMVILFASEDII